MKIFKSFSQLIIGMYVLSSLSHAQTITLDDFLSQLKQVHPLFEKETIAAQIEQQEQNTYLGNQDWNLYSSISYSHEEPAIAFAGPEKFNTFSINSGIERTFWSTGSRLGVSFTSSFARIDPTFGFKMPLYQNELAITYLHPLLKNKKGFLDQLEYNLKQFDIDFTEVQAFEKMEDFLACSAVKFLDWVLLTEQKKIIAERIKLSEEELARTQRKRDANLVDEVDVIRAEDAVILWRQNHVLAQARWNAIQAELAVLTQNDDFYNISPEFTLYEVMEPVLLEEAISQLKENSRLINVIDIRLKQLEYARKGFEETSRSDLSLFAQLNTKNLDEGFGDSFVMDKPDAIVGLQFTKPLENRTANYKIDKTDLQITHLQKEREDLTLTLISSLTNLYIQLKELQNVLKINQDQIESAKQRTKEELKLYNQGRGDLTFVILSRDNEENAKLSYAQNAALYHELNVQYHELLDEFLPSDYEEEN